MYKDPNQPQRPPYRQPQQPLPYGQAVNGHRQQPAFGQPSYWPPQQGSSQQYGQQYGQPQQVPFGQPHQQYGQAQSGFSRVQNYGPSYVSSQAKKSRRGKGRIILIVVLVLVVLIAGGAIAAVLLTSTTPLRTTTSTASTTSTVTTPSSQTQTVMSYYTAIKNQHYDTAFTYLDASGITIGGQKLTQSLYSKAGQSFDEQEGKVKAFAMAKTSTFSKNGGSFVQITMRVTRKTSMYSVILVLQQENGVWKIVGLDNI